MEPLRRLLERLADRGTPRGATEVLGRARAAAGTRRAAPTAWLSAAAAVAAVALVASVAVALQRDDTSTRVAGPTTTTTVPTTTSTTSGPVEAPVTTVAPATTSTTTTSTTRVTTSTAAKASSSTKGGAATVHLVSFNDCGSFVTDVKAKALGVVGPYGLPGGSGRLGAVRGRPATTAKKSATAAREPAGAPAAPTADDTSSTNVQEAGVDEPDTVKTDGQTIFTIGGGKLRAVAGRGTPRLLGSLAVDGNEAFLVGSKLLVLGSAPYRYPFVKGGASFAPSYGSSTITVVDVSDPAAMRVTSTLSVDGGYVAARAVGGVARIVIRSGPVGLDFRYPTDGTEAAQQSAEAHNRDVIRASSLTNWSPHVTVTDRTGRTTRQGTLLSCGQTYRPQALAGFGMLTVVTLDPNDPARSTSTSVQADGDLVYASTGRLYVATNQWGRIIDDQTVEPSASTLVHAFDIGDRGTATYVASGSVRGTVLNQFSFSEHEGDLRVATTDSAGGSQSFVTVLEQRGKELVTRGQVGGLGQGERIYAVRFIGALGYVVTFRQMDPLYVLDLADPTNPRVVGELKIPGYSSYLHPVGDGLLLGIGRDADANGRQTGTQVSLFDVSDPANPRRLQQAPLGSASSSSQAEYDHHAFLWWPATNLAVLPLNEYGQPSPFYGAVGMRVTPESISETGRVQHPAQPNQAGQQSWSPPIERTLVVGGRLFTVSDAGILASDLATFQSQTWVPFPQG